MKPTALDVYTLFVGSALALIADELARWNCLANEGSSTGPDSPKQPAPAAVGVPTRNLFALTEFAENCGNRLRQHKTEEILQLAAEMVKFFRREKHTWTMPITRLSDLGVSAAFEPSEQDLLWLRDQINHFEKSVRSPQPLSVTTTVQGPLGEKDSAAFQSLYGKMGGHYNIYQMHGGVRTLRSYFRSGEADPWNFVLFSTSGMHGTYTTIEDIAGGLEKYGDEPEFSPDQSEWPRDWHGNQLTVLIVQPRLVCLRFGVVEVSIADISFLKRLRETSYDACARIGGADFREWVRSVIGEVQSMYLPPAPARVSDN